MNQLMVERVYERGEGIVSSMLSFQRWIIASRDSNIWLFIAIEWSKKTSRNLFPVASDKALGGAKVRRHPDREVIVLPYPACITNQRGAYLGVPSRTNDP